MQTATTAARVSTQVCMVARDVSRSTGTPATSAMPPPMSTIDFAWNSTVVTSLPYMTPTTAQTQYQR